MLPIPIRASPLGPNMQLNARRDKGLKAAIIAMSCARAQPAKPPDPLPAPRWER